MQGYINVAAIMESQNRSKSEAESFVHRQCQMRITNALWAYHRSIDKAEVVSLFSEEFARLNKRKLGY